MTSNSDSSSAKKHEKQIEFEVSSKPTSDFRNGRGITASNPFPSNSSLSMKSDSDTSSAKKDEKQIEFEVSSKPSPDFPNGCGITASVETEHDQEEEEEAEETESTDSSTTSSDLAIKNPPLFSGAIEVSENDDGFKTPTDQMIPEITVCPPAPKRQRRKQESRKRKASPLRIRRCLRIDFSGEVESLFPPSIQEDSGRKIKRSRSGKTD